MKEGKQFLLNIVAIISFILYAIGIYLHVAILGEKWGNVAVDFAIEIVGALWGVIFVVLIGALILLLSFYASFTFTIVFLSFTAKNLKKCIKCMFMVLPTSLVFLLPSCFIITSSAPIIASVVRHLAPFSLVGGMKTRHYLDTLYKHLKMY